MKRPLRPVETDKTRPPQQAADPANNTTCDSENPEHTLQTALLSPRNVTTKPAHDAIPEAF